MSMFSFTLNALGRIHDCSGADLSSRSFISNHLIFYAVGKAMQCNTMQGTKFKKSQMTNWEDSICEKLIIWDKEGTRLQESFGGAASLWNKEAHKINRANLISDILLELMNWYWSSKMETSDGSVEGKEAGSISLLMTEDTTSESST